MGTPMDPLRQIMRVALHWAIAWGMTGLVVGALLMLRKMLPFAGLGGQAADALGSVFWIPALGAGAAAAGLGIGLVYACLMAWTADWRDSYEAPGLVGALTPYVLCGAAAGLVPGLLVGGFTGAFFFAGLGAGSAAALNWQAAKST
jgi:hypothetical protein